MFRCSASFTYDGESFDADRTFVVDNHPILAARDAFERDSSSPGSRTRSAVHTMDSGGRTHGETDAYASEQDRRAAIERKRAELEELIRGGDAGSEAGATFETHSTAGTRGPRDTAPASPAASSGCAHSIASRTS